MGRNGRNGGWVFFQNHHNLKTQKYWNSNLEIRMMEERFFNDDETRVGASDGA